jgi:ATP-binding cassette, subfamily B, bacterial
LFVLIGLLGSRIAAAATQARQHESAVYSLVQRTMSAIKVVQAFTKEEEENRRFITASEQSLAADLRLYTLQSFYSGAINLGIALGTALVVWVGARHVLSGALSVGEVIVFISYLASLYAPINSIFETYGLTQKAKAGVERVFEILDIGRDIEEGSRVFPATGATGEVAFEGLSFQYVADRPILKEINLRIRPGERVAIVGPTGAGKSTLVSLVPRFYDPQAGRVTIDGVDIREFQLKSLRRQIAMVLQPPLVFPATIRENIAYGRPDASMEEVVSAARLARIHDSISRLPQGYDTLVGEQGADLSEGERQRLTIARAILLNASILILDEPTSSVDSKTEALIMEGLQQLMIGRTTFIIAHRLSTVREADLILVLHGGEIVEQGTFNELVRGHGPFASLYQTQFGLYEEGRKFRLLK